MGKNKDAKMPAITTRVDKEVYDWIKAKSVLTGYTMGAIITAIITRFYNDQK